jgi:hypothetical protein
LWGEGIQVAHTSAEERILFNIMLLFGFCFKMKEVLKIIKLFWDL